MRISLYALLVFTLAGCMGPYAKVLRLRDVASRRIDVHIGSMLPGAGREERYQLIDDVLVIDASDGMIKLPADVAARTWHSIEQLQLLSWKEKYLPRDVGASIADGAAWVVTIKFGAEQRELRGENAYPSRGAVDATTIDFSNNAFRALVDILRSLEKEAKKAPGPTP